MSSRYYTIVIPCYNEAARFSGRQIAEALVEFPEMRLCFVDDGSADATHEVLQAFVRSHPVRTRLIRLSENSGKAEAVRQGLLDVIETENAEFVGFWDADMATPLPVAPEFVRHLRANPNVEIAIGSRVRLLGRQIDRSALRHFTGRVFATLASFAIGLPVYDTQCGAKLFRNSRWLGVALQPPFRSRWAFDVELLGRFMAQGEAAGNEAKITEIPLMSWTDVTGSKVKLTSALIAMASLLPIAISYRSDARWNKASRDGNVLDRDSSDNTNTEHRTGTAKQY